MSVTFYLGRYTVHPEFGTILAPVTDHDHRRPETCCEDAELYGGNCDHADADEIACGCRRFEVQLAKANAVAVLTRLGLPVDPECPCGETTPDDMLGRALTGNVGLDDSGDPSVQDGNMIDCGHAPGYFTQTMERLAALAGEAQAQDAMVVWA